MNISQINLRLVVLLTISSVCHLARAGSIKLFGPKCGDGFDADDKKLKCGSSITPNVTLNLGSLCDDNKPLKLRVVREDADVDGNTHFDKYNK